MYCWTKAKCFCLLCAHCGAFLKRKVNVKAHCTQMKITLCIHASVLMNRLPKRKISQKSACVVLIQFLLACTLCICLRATCFLIWLQYFNIRGLSVICCSTINVCDRRRDRRKHCVQYPTYSASWRFKKGITKFLSWDEFAHLKQISTEIQEQGPHNTEQLFRVQFMEA